MATRLVRAKKRIKAARIPFRIPDRGDLPARMTAVLEAVYGAYVIDWATTGPQARARRSGGARARRSGPALGGARPGAG
jgi:predicted RNA polymerase sigma factor